MLAFNWSKTATQSVAQRLSWVVGLSSEFGDSQDVPDTQESDMKLPDTLIDPSQEHDDAVDHSDGHEAHDSAFVASATNWDNLLDAEGIATNGVSDPTTPKPPVIPPAPKLAVQDKANKKQRAGRGVEGQELEGPTNPMDSANKYNWNSLHTVPKI